MPYYNISTGYNKALIRTSEVSYNFPMNTEKNRFYITTPIYYANDIPHLGHTGTTVFADIIARHNRLLGKDVFFLTGNDEHGEKVASSAKKAGKEPQEFVDDLAVKWQEYWKKLNISNDHFFRTSSVEHKKYVSELLTKIKENGEVYEGVYEGYYCIGCEEFKTPQQLVDGKCPEHRPDQIVFKKEKNYFFKFSNYKETVLKYLEDGTIKVEPENKRNEMIATLKDYEGDLSISRENLTWGIKIPWDEAHVTYVWVEALMNYYTATKIWNKEEFWPADVHLIGKGNNWFHTVIWPALLLALKIELPLKVFVHGYYNVDGRKMGKSLGNVINPQELMDRYQVDGTRYLLAASMPYKEDSDVSFAWFTSKYNSDLADGLGNLVSRVAKLAEGLDIKTEEPKYVDLLKANKQVAESYESLKLQEVVEYLAGLVRNANEYLNKETPWKLEGDAKTNVIEASIRQILIIGKLLEPIMPETSQKICDIFTNDTMGSSRVLFQKIK